MKHIKNFDNYLIGGNDPKSVSVVLTPEDIFDYLGINTYDHEKIHINKYDINIQVFMNEVFLGKNIEFTSLDKINGNKDIKCKVKEVSTWYYKELYIIVNDGTDDNVIKPDSIIRIFDYDAEDKPLHKDIKIKQKAYKYNL